MNEPLTNFSIFPPRVERPVVLGVLGGGQLGAMFLRTAQTMGYRTVVFDPSEDSPAAAIAHHHIHADFLDQKALTKMADLCDAITIEFENVPAKALAYLESIKQLSPSSTAVSIAQNRLAEKQHFQKCGVKCAPFFHIESEADLDLVNESIFPAILKTTRMGYDGRGQLRVENKEKLALAWGSLRQVACVLEKVLPLKAECSIILARGFDGSLVNLPVQKNVHSQGILSISEVWQGNIGDRLAQLAVHEARKIVESLAYVGVMCVEFFILDETDPVGRILGPLVVNEIAPRPHNSGHYSLEAVDINQFELQVRTLTGMPLPEPQSFGPAAMINLLGDSWLQFGGEPNWEKVLQIPGVHLHLYGKLVPRMGRKMGHITVTGKEVIQVREKCGKVREILAMAPKSELEEG